MAVDGLPVMHHLARVFANQVGRDLLDGRGAGDGPAFENGLAQADDAGVGMHLEEQPTGFDQKGFELGDLESAPGSDGRIGLQLLGGRHGGHCSRGSFQKITAVHGISLRSLA